MKKDPVHVQLLQKNLKNSSEIFEKLLQKYENMGLIYVHKCFVEAGREQRLALAVRALELGADIEEICRFLDWKEFEQVAVLAFEANGYMVKKNFRFKASGRKWEIDVIGLKEPLILCADCKHWNRGLRKAATAKAVDAQIERAEAFASSIEKHVRQMPPQIVEWREILVLPIVISLVPAPFKFYRNVPIVPILQLRDFLHYIPAYMHEMKTFRGNFTNRRLTL